MCTGFWWGNRRERDYLGDPGVNGRIIIRWSKEMGGTCSAYGERRGVYRILVGKPEGKRLLGRPRIRWEDNNTKME